MKNFSSYTFTKQDMLVDFATKHATNLKDTPGTYTYVDLNGGQAIWNDEKGGVKCCGSPLIFGKILKESHPKFESFVFEDKQASALRLMQAVLQLNWRKQFNIINKSHETAPEVLRKKKAAGEALNKGLIYHDPTGVPNFTLVFDCIHETPDLDILLNVPASSIKRCAKRQVFDWDLGVMINLIRKDFLYITEPVTKFHWTFLFGTNNPNVIPDPNHFVDIDSKEGKRRRDKAVKTREELAECGRL